MKDYLVTKKYQKSFYLQYLNKSKKFKIHDKDLINNLIKDIFTIDDTRLQISKKIKESFDQKGIFNPGKMYAGV